MSGFLGQGYLGNDFLGVPSSPGVVVDLPLASVSVTAPSGFPYTVSTDITANAQPGLVTATGFGITSTSTAGIVGATATVHVAAPGVVVVVRSLSTPAFIFELESRPLIFEVP